MSAQINWKTIEQTEKAQGLSKKYNVISSSEIVKRFEDKGFEITSYTESKVRNEENKNKQKHMIRMALSDQISMPERPEAIIVNSYNGSSRLNIRMGVYRFVCSNGMIVGTDTQDAMSIKHTNKQWDYLLYKFMNDYERYSEQQHYRINRMKTTYMSREREYEFAERAIQLRENPKDVLDIGELLQVRRVEDKGDDLWLTFNKVQEALINGLFQKIFYREDTQERVYSKAATLNDVRRINAINAGLGELAREFTV